MSGTEIGFLGLAMFIGTCVNIYIKYKDQFLFEEPISYLPLHEIFQYGIIFSLAMAMFLVGTMLSAGGK